jgi:nucleoside-diphosphate-sugar epimerase
VKGANGDGFETVIVRPRFVWGAGATTVPPSIVAMVKSGRFAWIGGGKQLTDITHVDQAYFVTDGEPVVFREFVTALVERQDWLLSQECTIDIGKARRELGYRPVKRRAEGLAELRGAG